MISRTEADDEARSRKLRIIESVTASKTYIPAGAEVLAKDPSPEHGWANLVYRTDKGIVFARVKEGMTDIGSTGSVADRKAAEADASAWLAGHPEQRAPSKVFFEEYEVHVLNGSSALVRRHVNLFKTARPGGKAADEIKALKAEIESLKARIADLEKGVA